MSPISTTVTFLKWLTAAVAIITPAIAGAFTSRVVHAFKGTSYPAEYPAAQAIMTGSILASVYFLSYGLFVVKFPDSLYVSVIADVASITALFIFFLISSAALSLDASLFARFSQTQFCQPYRDGGSWCQYATATVALGWFITGFLLIILILEVALTLDVYDAEYSAWRRRFGELFGDQEYRPTRRGREASAEEGRLMQELSRFK
ncbi:hypothetical protein L198_07678 [Cryptococcus wingfieldii CBS 7118]|uniref:MARVEL domain-containing protein n=1 Tax=Cryptococcus wingfieldii CBS 7118 TaxID=1295528 RepID=A0A1E3I5G2_9TREE|nr:hypothetical protein L198_07678 [Cryptococcus wingfieldii CBS 7118]ODN83782.1 hypothetical protein L198_07678 [Cryptococcus wingfieldii CBS 7118]